MRDILLIALPVLPGFVAVYLLLPRPRRYPPLWGAAAAGLALLLAGTILTTSTGAAVESILFYTFATIAVSSGALLITQRNPVYAALAFALVVLSTCGLFLLQAAPFLMAATIIIYAGAIIVTFLFVIMLAQQAGLSDADARSREPLLASVAGFVLLGALLFVLQQAYQGKASVLNAPPVDADAFASLLERMDAASGKKTVTEMAEALGDEEGQFFEDLGRQIRAGRSTPATRHQADQLLHQIESSWWNRWKPAGDAGAMRTALEQLRQRVQRVVEERGRAGLPGENVAHLGKILFSQYLIGVELAGLLLLVAAIGAIAITHRRAEELR